MSIHDWIFHSVLVRYWDCLTVQVLANIIVHVSSLWVGGFLSYSCFIWLYTDLVTGNTCTVCYQQLYVVMQGRQKRNVGGSLNWTPPPLPPISL